MENQPNQVINIENFAANTVNAKSPVQAVVKYLIRETFRNRFTYDQLRFIFKSVRVKCEVNAPSRKRKLYELPSEEELKKFYVAIRNAEHRLIFETLEGSGLRISELCHLQVSRIDFKNATAFIDQGKGRKDRVIVLGRRLLDKLELYLQNRRNKFLFESSRNHKFSPRRIEQLCKQYREAAGLSKTLTPHCFRHLWNTRLVEAGVSKEIRMLLAGHESEATQKVYTHIGIAGAKSQMIEVLDRIAIEKGRT